MLVEVKCEKCGADLEFKPGTKGLTCHYCQHTMVFEEPESPLEAHQELDLEAYLREYDTNSQHLERHVVSCDSCGAETELDSNQQASSCPFCDTPLVVAQAHSKKLIKPKSLLPFLIEKRVAKSNFKTWLNKLWFAPNDLKKQITKHDKFKGIYLPYWTYDCDTGTSYVGQRGDYYYETVTSRNSEGQTVTRQVRRTRWRAASGYVTLDFDDVLVPASRSLPREKLYALEPWDLHSVVDYKDEYLSGYIAESYQVDLKEGYGEAKGIMKKRIEQKVRHDIGGDVQRIFRMNTRYSSATFKHLLLPVWVSAYRYKEKLYQIMVNARSGEVQGERPYSWIKIALALLAVTGLVIGVTYLVQTYNAT